MKKMLNKHWNCIPWFVSGLSIIIRGEIGRFTYGLAWISVLILLWHYCPAIGFKEMEEQHENEGDKSM